MASIRTKEIGFIALVAGLAAATAAIRAGSAHSAARPQPPPRRAPAGDAVAAPAEPPPARSLRCALRPGERVGYALRSSSVYGVSGQVNPQADPAQPQGPLDTQRRSIEGDLLLRALGEPSSPPGEPPVQTLAAVVERAAVDGRPDLAEALSTPVLVRVDERCQVREIGVTDAVAPAGRNQWASLLKQLEFVLSDGPSRSWSAPQSDPLGAFVASYTRSDAPDGRATVQRRRGGYQRLHGDGSARASASVLGSRGAAVWLAGEDHPREVEVDERMVLKIGGSTVADVTASVRLAVRDESGSTSAFWSRPIRPEKYAFLPADQLVKEPLPPRFSDRPAIAGLASKSTADVLAEAAALLARKPSANHDGALNLLVQYLRLRPEAARALLDEVRAGKVADGVRPFVFLGMELAGGKAVHGELAGAAADRRMSNADRLRAISALSQVPDADASVAGALTRLARERDGSAEGAERRTGAVLGLGVAAREESALPADEKKKIAAFLGDDLARASSPGDAVDALGAMGNAGDPSFRGAAAAMSGDPRPGVAAAAYRALHRLDALPPQKDLLDALSGAQDRALRSELTTILSEQKLDPALVARCAALLDTNPPSPTRALLIALLGSVARDSAEAKAALVRHFAVEKEARLLALIGRFVSSQDLP